MNLKLLLQSVLPPALALYGGCILPCEPEVLEGNVKVTVDVDAVSIDVEEGSQLDNTTCRQVCSGLQGLIRCQLLRRDPDTVLILCTTEDVGSCGV